MSGGRSSRGAASAVGNTTAQQAATVKTKHISGGASITTSTDPHLTEEKKME